MTQSDAMPQHDLMQRIRIRVYGIAAAITLLLTLAALGAADYRMSLVALVFTLLLAANAWANWRLPSGQEPLVQLAAHLLVGFLALITVVSFVFSPNLAEPWCYLFPLVVFLVYRLRLATTLTAGYAVLVMFSLIQFHDEPAKVQIFFSFVLCLAMTLAFVYLRELKEQQLKPLRRTDTLTLASTHEYLAQDLDKEIQRSEREGTELAVLALALDPECLEGRSQDLDLLLNRLGRILHENLRLFDGYYRYDRTEFIVILPHANTRQAMKTAEHLRLQCKKQLGDEDQPVTISLGVVTLNVGDDSASLIAMARKALAAAQARGSNQTCSHVDLESTDGTTDA